MTQCRLVNSSRRFGESDCFQLRDSLRLYLDCHKKGGSTMNRQVVMTQKTRVFTDRFACPTIDLVWTLGPLLQCKKCCGVSNHDLAVRMNTEDKVSCYTTERTSWWLWLVGGGGGAEINVIEYSLFRKYFYLTTSFTLSVKYFR